MQVERYLAEQAQDSRVDQAERIAIQELLSQTQEWNKANMVREFSPGTLKDIERNHGVVFNPLESSLAKLVAAKKPFWGFKNRDNPDFMNLVSRPTQIAIFPEPQDFYVPESNNLHLDQQRELLAVDEIEVVKKKMGIGGLRLIMGDVATHTGLVFAYFDRSEPTDVMFAFLYRSDGIRLHGADYDYRYARTETPTVGSRVACVGVFKKIAGLSVYDGHAGEGFRGVWAVRLGAPVQE